MRDSTSMHSPFNRLLVELYITCKCPGYNSLGKGMRKIHKEVVLVPCSVICACKLAYLLGTIVIASLAKQTPTDILLKTTV